MKLWLRAGTLLFPLSVLATSPSAAVFRSDLDEKASILGEYVAGAFGNAPVGIEPVRAAVKRKTRVVSRNLLGEPRDVARGEDNLLHPIRAALAADASIGEVCGAMRDVFGEYKGGAFF